MLIGKNITFRLNKKNYKAEKLFKINSNTISDWIPMEVFEKEGLGFGNGRDWARDDGTFCRKYNLKLRCGIGGKVTHMKIDGYAAAPKIRGNIPNQIRLHYSNRPCVFTGIYRPGHMECDHKKARYIEGNTLEEFQSVLDTFNGGIKKQACKVCELTNQRYDARVLGYCVGWTVGNNILTTEKSCCEGCYMSDPVVFRKTISAQFVPVE